jgi:hypothetical protein
MRRATALAAFSIVASALLAHADEGHPTVFFAADGETLWPLACVKSARLVPGAECVDAVTVGYDVVGADNDRSGVAAVETRPGCRQPLLRVTRALRSPWALWPATSERGVVDCSASRKDARGCTGDLDGDGRPDRVRVVSGRRHDQVLVALGKHAARPAKIRWAADDVRPDLDEHITLAGLVDLDGDNRDEVWIQVLRTPRGDSGEGAISHALLRWTDGGFEPIAVATCWGD